MDIDACPFCKSLNIRVVAKTETFVGYSEAQNTLIYVKCGVCNSRGPHMRVVKPEIESGILESEFEAIDMWNKVPRK
jgi:hypothetical protein